MNTPGGSRWASAAWASAAWALALLCLGAPTALSAQSILGRVVDAESGNPVVGAVVLLLDGQGQRLDAKLTDEAGSFGFVGAMNRPYRLRAEMIGRQGVDVGPFTLEGDARHDLRLPAAPIRLGGLDVTGEKRMGVKTIAPIAKGSEILVDYGGRYFERDSDSDSEMRESDEEFAPAPKPKKQRTMRKKG